LKEVGVVKKQLRVLAPNNTGVLEGPKPLRVLGIDLGTTNSTVSEVVWNPDEATKLESRCIDVEQETLSGNYTHVIVPSAVALYNGKEWVGEGAKRLYTRAPELGLELTKNVFLECKNDIGSRRTYHRAPEGYRSAPEIGARLLSFLKRAAEQDGLPIARTVVTVPASFQAAQRMDTVKAARLAGIPLSGGDLLDEPVAAFLDYLMAHSGELDSILARERHLLVFDFGGGTCDVAVFKLTKGSGDLALDISPLAVSRYHRLGGGDIDKAILYEVLLPQLLEQNSLSQNSLTYEEKKTHVEPAFIGIAEALKVGLCNEISRLQGFGQYESADKATILKKHPGVYSCKVAEKSLSLQSPSLSCAQFEEVLKPFLDRDLLYARETEYRLTCSVFAPIQDALDRCGLDCSDIDLCLLVGGSSLIPQVAEAVDSFFETADLITFPDQDSLLIAVARGAAYHALALQAFGRSVFQVKTPDRLSIRTVGGAYELVPKNTALPYPLGGEWAQTLDLKIPETSIRGPVPLLVEFVAGEEKQERSLFVATWNVAGPVQKGDGLKLEYRLDENQVLQFRLTLADQPESNPFDGSIENPLSNVVNPHTKRLEIQESEEALRLGKVPKDQVPEKVVEIARGYAEIQQLEKAISYLKQALRLLNRPEAYILNLLGIYAGARGDHENEEKYYLEAAKAGGGKYAFFNLSLAYYQQKDYEKAKAIVSKSLAAEAGGPGLTLAAQIADALDDADGRASHLDKALPCYGKVRSMSDWELGWFSTAATMAAKTELVDAAKAEIRRRKLSTGKDDQPGSGLLPEISNVPRVL
jgi:molecular chaperone DnaK